MYDAMKVGVLKIGLIVVVLSGLLTWYLSFTPEHNTTIQLSTELPYLNTEQKATLLDLGLSVLQDQPILLSSEDEDYFAEYGNSVIAVIREDGEYRNAGRAQQGSLDRSVVAAVAYAQRTSPEPLNEPEDYSLHLFVLGPDQPLDAHFVLGADSVHIDTQGRDIWIWPSFQVEHNYREDTYREKLCTQVDKGSNCHQDGSTQVYYAKTLHFGQSRDRDRVVDFYRGKETTDFQPLGLTMLQDLQQSATRWLIDNLTDEGYFNYLYNPSNGTYSTSNNMIRQLMASRHLAELAQSDASLLEKHRANLNYIMTNRYQEDGEYGYVYYDDKSKLGAIAMLLRTFVASPLYAEYADQATKLYQTILSLQSDDGAFEPWYIAPDYGYDEDYLLTFYSGEGLLALVEYYLAEQDPAILEQAVRGQDFYLQRYVDDIDQRYYPAYVPRHTLSLYKLYEITRDDRYAQGIFQLNDKLIYEMLHTDNDEPEDLLGRFYNPAFHHYGSPHSASDGVYLEGLVYAYDLATRLGDTIRELNYFGALELAVHNIRVLQYRDEDMYFMHYPERVDGAVRYHVNDNRIRIDTTQHMLDGLSKLIEIVQKD